MPPMLKDSVGQAVEIAKAGMQMPAGSMFNSPETVAEFIEVVAKKINDLLTTPLASG